MLFRHWSIQSHGLVKQVAEKMEGAERIPQMCEIDRLAAMKRLQEKESLGFSGFLTVR